MKKLILLLTAIVITVSCEKRDCVSWYLSESKNIVIDTTDYINASDLGNKYFFNYEVAECDDLRLMELLSIDGKEIKVCGCLSHDLIWGCSSIYTLGETGSVPLEGHLMDTLPHDSTVYYVTGIARVFTYRYGMVFKRNGTAVKPDSTAQIFFQPTKYTVKK